jgi:hypothetical protein
MLVCKQLVRAPLAPKPGHLTQSPCLDGVGRREFFKKIKLQPFCSLCLKLSKMKQNGVPKRLDGSVNQIARVGCFCNPAFSSKHRAW